MYKSDGMDQMSVPDEAARLRELTSFEILGSEPEFAYDELARLASEICGTPIALVTLVDHDRQWFKAKIGLEIDETPRDVAFCAQAIVHPTDVMVVEDATTDPRFSNNPLVLGDPQIRFYAGAPLITPTGNALGTLCVIDRIPRRLTESQAESLRLLARQVMVHLELRRSFGVARRANRMLEALAQVQSDFLLTNEGEPSFDTLLKVLLELTDSEYGFIGEVLTSTAGAPYLRIVGHAITDISWDETTRNLYNDNLALGMEFHNLNTLFGAALVTREVVIANNPGNDPRRGGLPTGHPAMRSFMGIPIYSEGTMVGMAGLANRPSGYTDALVEFLAPFATTCGTLIGAHRLNAQRRAAERQLAEQNARLLELDTLKSELIASVSHELRTPLTSVLSLVELLTGDALPETERKEIIVVIQRNATRLRRLIADILLFSSLESNGVELLREQVDVAKLVAECVESHQSEAAERGLSVTMSVQSSSRVTGDSMRLAQVFDNLISNAIKFTGSGGRIRVSVYRADRSVVIDVADNGLGIKAGEVPAIFEAFGRSSTATASQIPGTGIGLSIVRRLVELHGGSVSVDSTEGVGTTFQVHLPAEMG